MASTDTSSLASDIRDYVRILRRRWWLVVLASALAVAAAWWVQRGTIPRYTAEALLRLQGETSVLPGSLRPSQPNEKIGSEIEIVRSRSVLQSVVVSLGLQVRLQSHRSERTGLISSIHVDPEPRWGRYELHVQTIDESLQLFRQEADEHLVRIGSFAFDEPVSGPGFELELSEPSKVHQPVEFEVHNRQAAIEQLRGRLRVEPGKGPDLIKIAYSSPDAELAAAVVNRVARSYQDYGARTAREAASRRRRVISDQLVHIADSLRSVQDSLLEYQRENQLLDPSVEGNALMSERFRIEDRMRELRFREGLLESLVAGLQSSDASDSSLNRIMSRASELIDGGEALYGRLQELQSERQRLTASRVGYTSADPKVEALDSLIHANRERMEAAARQSLDLLRSRLGSAEDRLAELKRETGELPAQTASLSRLEQRVSAVQDVFDMLVEKYYEAQIAEGTESGDVRLVDPAPVPLAPNPTRSRMNYIVALITGLFVGALGAIGIDKLDSSIQDATAVEQISDLPLIGTIPRLGSDPTDGEEALVAKEAVRGIRTNLKYLIGGSRQVVAVSSPGPQEGKSTLAANLAISLAEQGQRTLLVDCDLRAPRVGMLFGLGDVRGLADLLVNSGEEESSQLRDFSSYVHRSSAVENLEVLPSGDSSAHAVEMFGSKQFEVLLTTLRSNYENVILDTPPVLAVSETAHLAAASDGTVLVVSSGDTEEEALRQTVLQLRRIGVTLIGVVVNRVRNSSGYGSYNYYTYHSYYTDGSPTKKEGAKNVQPLLLEPSQSLTENRTSEAQCRES